MPKRHFSAIAVFFWLGSAMAAEPSRIMSIRQVVPDPNNPIGAAFLLIQVQELGKDSNGESYLTRSYPVVAKALEAHAFEFDPTIGNDLHRLDPSFGNDGLVGLRDWEGYNRVTNPRIAFAADGSFALAGELSSREPKTLKEPTGPETKILSDILRLLDASSMLELRERQGDIKPEERAQMNEIHVAFAEALEAHNSLPKSLKAASRQQPAAVGRGFVSRFSSDGKPIQAFGLNGTQVFAPLAGKESLGNIAINSRREIAVPSADPESGLSVRVYQEDGSLLAERKIPRNKLPPLKRGGHWIAEASVTQSAQTKVLVMAGSDWLLDKKPVYEINIPHDSNVESSFQGVVRVSPKNALTGEAEGALVYGAYSGDGNTVWIASDKDDATKVRSFKVREGEKPTFGPIYQLEDRGFGQVITLRANPATNEVSIVGRLTEAPENTLVFTAEGSGQKPFHLEAVYTESHNSKLSLGAPSSKGHTCSVGFTRLVNRALSKKGG